MVIKFYTNIFRSKALQDIPKIGFLGFENVQPWLGCQMVRFQTKNTNLGNFLEGVAMLDVGIFYGHLVYVMTICNILRLLGIF
jgi:hypothetical protein